MRDKLREVNGTVLSSFAFFVLPATHPLGLVYAIAIEFASCVRRQPIPYMLDRGEILIIRPDCLHESLQLLRELLPSYILIVYRGTGKRRVIQNVIAPKYVNISPACTERVQVRRRGETTYRTV